MSAVYIARTSCLPSQLNAGLPAHCRAQELPAVIFQFFRRGTKKSRSLHGCSKVSLDQAMEQRLGRKSVP